MIHVLVADDQQLIRGGFRSLLENEPGIVVVGEAGNGSETIAAVRMFHPDGVLVNIRMPNGDGLGVTGQIVADPERRSSRIVVVTPFELDEYVARAVKAGASGFLVMDSEPVELICAVHVVVRGEALLRPSVTRRVLERVSVDVRDTPDTAPLAVLAGREREVLALVGAGYTNVEIGQRLLMSPLTAKTLVSRIMAKLAACDRVQPVVVAYATGLVEPGRAE